ncbi:MAG: sigma-70 family RNA polymerase sigma factor [Firmicutes bacterium]|nr:sigma-70 family RNA polymerase sigma factor [Bacillota bacterium]
MRFSKFRHRTILEDEQIVQLYWTRDETAIQRTDDKYGALMYRVAYNVLHDRQDCEECRNDAYLGVWNAIPPNRPEVLPVFLCKIMRNVALMKFREKTRKKRIPSEMLVSIEDLANTLHSADSPECQCQAAELGRLINGYLAGLTERQQYIFVGRFYMGDTLETIAGGLGVNASTVHREIGKIKQGLKSYLERNDVYV